MLVKEHITIIEKKIVQLTHLQIITLLIMLIIVHVLLIKLLKRHLLVSLKSYFIFIATSTLQFQYCLKCCITYPRSTIRHFCVQKDSQILKTTSMIVLNNSKPILKTKILKNTKDDCGLWIQEQLFSVVILRDLLLNSMLIPAV